MRLSLLIITCAFIALPAAVRAQRPGGTPDAVVARPPGLSMTDGEPISFVLEHSRELDLSDMQRMGLVNIRRRLRVANDPHMKQLDSLREYLGLTLEPRPRGLSEEERKKLERFQQLARPIADSIKVNNDAASVQARSLLDSAQVFRLDSLIVSERSPRRPPGRR